MKYLLLLAALTGCAHSSDSSYCRAHTSDDSTYWQCMNYRAAASQYTPSTHGCHMDTVKGVAVCN